jgi:hypothetical protein
MSFCPTILEDGEILLHIVLSQKEDLKKSTVNSADSTMNATVKFYCRIVKENELVKLPWASESPEDSTWVEFTAKIVK